MTGTRSYANDADIDLKRLFVAIWERRRVVLLAVLLAGLSAFAVSSLMHPLYKADTRILIQARNGLTGTADGGQSGSDQAILDEQGVKSQVQVIESADLIQQVIGKLHLADRTEFGAGGPSMVGRVLSALHLAGSPEAGPSRQDVLDRFTSKLNVYQVASSRVIVIEFSSRDPKLAAEVSNTLANVYLLRQSGLKLSDDSQAAAWLQPEIARLRKRVDAAESKVADYRAKAGLLSVGNNDTLASRELGDTATELSKVRSQRADAEARASNVRDALKNGRGVDTLANVVDSPLIQQLRQQEVAAQAQLADLATSLGSRHPRIRAVKSQIAELDRRIKAESHKVLASLENEASIARLREQELVRQMNELKQNSGRAGEQQVKLQALQREATADRDLLNRYLARYRAASSRNSPDALPADARIISNAVVPAKPYFPKTVPIVVVAMLATFLVASVWIMLAELFSGRALRPVDASPAIGEPEVQQRSQVLAPVSRTVASFAAIRLSPSRDGAARRFEEMPAGHDGTVASSTDEADAAAGAERPVDAQVSQDPAAPAAAAVAAAGTAGGEASAGDDGRDFSIAAAAAYLMDRERAMAVCISPEGDEGSAASVILARLLAEEGMRVVLVDMTPTGGPTLLMSKHDGQPGMTDLLTRKVGFSEAIHGDRISPAHFMPRGTSDPQQAMRAGERLPMVLDGLRDAYQVVLVECGRAGVSEVRRLVRNATDFELIVTAVEPAGEGIVETLSEFGDAGFGNPIVMMPGLSEPRNASDTHAA